jgi:hypothetical protein
MKWFIQIGESQLLGVLDESVAGRVGPCRGHFRHNCAPAMDGHRKPPTSRAGKTGSSGSNTAPGATGRYCPLGQTWSCTVACGALRKSGLSISGLYDMATGEGVVINNPTRSAMETASAND